MRDHVNDRRDGQNASRLGSSETDVSEFTINPAGSPSGAAVTKVTPVAAHKRHLQEILGSHSLPCQQVGGTQQLRGLCNDESLERGLLPRIALHAETRLQAHRCLNVSTAIVVPQDATNAVADSDQYGSDCLSGWSSESVVDLIRRFDAESDTVLRCRIREPTHEAREPASEVRSERVAPV
jgi:hypothetical protein